MMEGPLSASDQQSMVASFLEIAVGQTPDTARQFLQATSWKLEEAIQLFLLDNESGAIASSSHAQASENVDSWADQSSGELKEGAENEVTSQNDDEVRPPLPVIRETLYDDALLHRASRMGHQSQEPSSLIAFRNFDEEMRRPGVWDSEQGAVSISATESSRDNLASLYRPPFHLMFHGPFEKAKNAASVRDKWLLINIQSTKEFSSHMLNRDTWANETVSQTISTNFIFWQVYDDTIEGQKVCTYYKLNSIPVVLVIDPITGQKMRSWSGMVQPETLLEDLLQFMEGGPKDHHVTLSHKRPRESLPKSETNEDNEIQRANACSIVSMKDSSPMTTEDKDEVIAEKEKDIGLDKKPAYPPLPEEPKGDRKLLCRVGVRLPDGRRVQRNFLQTDPIKLLWSFCCMQLGEDETKAFRLAHAIPGASRNLDYESNMTFEESGLANSMISVTWE